MVHLVLGLCIAASIGISVGFGVLLIARSHFRGKWYRFFLVVVALLAIAMLLYLGLYFCFVYVSDGNALCGRILYNANTLVYAVLVVLVPVTAIRVRRSHVAVEEWIYLAGMAATIVASSLAGDLIGTAIVRRAVLALRYALLVPAFVWAYGVGFSAPGVGVFYSRFSLVSAGAFLVITVDAVVLRFSLSSEDYVPDGVISLPLYGIGIGLMLIHFATTRLQTLRSNVGLSAAFLTEYEITPREGQIIRCLLKGETNNRIGEELYISPRTVDTHFSNIYRKCGVRSRLELVRLINEFE